VGREPVRYVSNINKYYLSYVMADEILRLRGNKKESIQKDTQPLPPGLPFRPANHPAGDGASIGGFCLRSIAPKNGVGASLW